MVEPTLQVDLAMSSSLLGPMVAALVGTMVVAMEAVAALQEDAPQEEALLGVDAVWDKFTFLFFYAVLS